MHCCLWYRRWHSEPVWEPVLHSDLHECDEPLILAPLDGGPPPVHQVSLPPSFLLSLCLCPSLELTGAALQSTTSQSTYLLSASVLLLNRRWQLCNLNSCDALMLFESAL